ncbi:Flavin-dependent monooxygenase, oxygenase subunit HsaA [Micromonospora sp. MW-13]|uniref:acyl-CoA dehydrogenase family protein n=1 Tax=Micromonospora sp. MW-13 TaxID=2094022 RepID=UPI000E42F945|nr:acyl-CoA dehydrogenase family protein [Micromonospora sp. MW-13]RGC66132.1 Flavin-dependent monooxygenase, oxygenase subunit HsaA [Micromonospora sp. MW-13]
MDEQDRIRLTGAVRELVPELSRRAEDIEASRELPADLLDGLRAAGCFRMFVPRSHGGYEADPHTGLAVLEALARADGSTGWTVMIGAETPHLLALLPRDRFDKLYAAGPDVVVAGGFAPQGRAELADGGFQVTGRWGFASGSRHADWIFGNCVLTGDGQPLPGPGGQPVEVRSMLLPAGAVRVQDTWHTLGLRGTGSHDVLIESVFCPAEQSFDLFTGVPCVPGPGFVAPLAQFVLHLGAVAVGIAQGALDDTVALLDGGRQRLYARQSLADSPAFRVQLGRADLNVRAARALVRSLADDLYRAACAEDPVAVEALRPQVSASLPWVTEVATAAVDVCYRAGGGGAARDSSPVQRRFRDIHTFAQHAAAAEGWLGNNGAHLLGRPVELAY